MERRLHERVAMMKLSSRWMALLACLISACVGTNESAVSSAATSSMGDAEYGADDAGIAADAGEADAGI
ncbi:MAG TPA: hypothetical protein VIU61_07040, partial [Kofleriaceae bacterium]